MVTYLFFFCAGLDVFVDNYKFIQINWRRRFLVSGDEKKIFLLDIKLWQNVFLADDSHILLCIITLW